MITKSSATTAPDSLNAVSQQFKPFYKRAYKIKDSSKFKNVFAQMPGGFVLAKTVWGVRCTLT